MSDPDDPNASRILTPGSMPGYKMWTVDKSQLLRLQEDLDVDIISKMETQLPKIGRFSGKFISHEKEAILYSKLKLDQNLFRKSIF